MQYAMFGCGYAFSDSYDQERVGAGRAFVCRKIHPSGEARSVASIIENKLLPGNLKEPLFWHVDRSATGERARAAVCSLPAIAFGLTVHAGSCR